jgi:hypothetical protein
VPNSNEAISNEAKARAEASFKRKEQQAVDGAKAWAEYQAQRVAVAEKTERLRALRLAKEAKTERENTKKIRRPTPKRGPAAAASRN